MFTQVPLSPTLTSSGLSSPTFSGFLLCRLYRLKASRAPAKTSCQARPGLFSEWVSHPGKRVPGLQRGTGFLVGTAPPGGHIRYSLSPNPISQVSSFLGS